MISFIAVFSIENEGFIKCLKEAPPMKMSARLLALSITILFIGSTMTAFVEPFQPESEEQILEEVHTPSYAATAPGHSVWAEYYGADWCPPCQNGGSPSMNALKTGFPDDFVYISYFEANGQGVPDPLNRLSHMRDGTGSIPAANFGDARAGSSYHKLGAATGTTAYDTEFSNGGDMKDVNDYSLSVTQVQNGANMEITYELQYFGSAASKTVYLLAVIVEDKGPDTYNDGTTHPHNVIRGWLLNSAGNGLESFTLTPNNPVTKTWTKPVSTVRSVGSTSAADNFVSVGAVMGGPHTSWNDVYVASDSNMAPKLDISVTSVSMTNPAAPNGAFVIGDTVNLETTVSNVGDLDYTDGGTIEFFYKEGVNEVSIGTTALNNLNAPSSQTAQISFDTSVISSELKTKFGARLTNLVADGNSGNNVNLVEINQDRPPITKNPQITGDQTIDRGSHAIVLAKSDTVPGNSDFVDDASTVTFNVEISPTGQNQWFSSVVSGGQNVVYATTSNEGREYVIAPTAAMSSGWYDVRTQAVDSRGQTGEWKIVTGTSGFELENGAPTVITDPIPSVMCDTPTKVLMDGHIVDPETPLEDLIVTSSDESFVAWHAETKEIEVNFQWSEINGCPLGEKGIDISIDDGGDYSQQGHLPYGTLLFRVSENGQPRWSGLPSQSVAEGGSGVLALMPYLSDTDASGNPTSVDGLTIELLSNSNEDVITATLIGNTIGFETVDDDVNGQTILTLRASDGVMTSDATLTINIDPINDAPRIIPFDDLESISLKRNTQMVIDLDSRIVDVDDTGLTYVRVSSSEPGAARYSALDGSLTLSFEDIGMQTVSIVVEDGKLSDTFVMQVDVFDAYPFLLTQVDDGTGYMFVALEDTYIGQTPTVNMMLTDASPTFTYISVTWNICSSLTGTCDGLMQYDLDISQSNLGWSKELLIPSVLNNGLAREDGAQYMDYYELSILANDGDSEFKTMSTMKWNITESMPAIVDMDDEMFTDYLGDLIDEKADLESQIESAQGDTTLLEDKLTEIEAELDLACDDPRATCISDAQSGTGDASDSSEINMTLVGIIASVVILGLLLTLMFTRRSGKDSMKLDAWNDTGWNPNTVPAHDSVANSMYGGAQNLFQQPVAIAPVHQPMPAAPAQQPAPVAPAQQIAGPPLPPGGLPAGWTAEQWAYYGQQYLDGTL